ncbi:MAG: MqnA/MqnD/SBP family protein [Thermomicrobiales bacterium]
MTLLIDDALLTAPFRMPLTEGWAESSLPVEVKAGLVAADVGAGDVALLPSAEATLLAESHVVLPEVAIVVAGPSPWAMRTPVRPDAVDESLLRLLDVSGTGELLIRALLKPFYGIVASSARFLADDSDPAIADAQVVVIEGIEALVEPEMGFQSDLAQAWFILTGAWPVGYVLVSGIEALANGDADRAIAILEAALAVGIERRRDVRTAIVGTAPDPEAIDRERLAELTNSLRFSLGADDRRSLQNLIARGTWGSRFPQKNPTFRDDLPADLRGGVEA